MNSSRSVLIADNDPLVRRALRRLLAGAGFEPREATSGEEVLAILDTPDAPLAVLLDLDLPDMQGEDVLRAVRDAGNGVAVVVHSGALEGAHSDSLLAAGADACLAKPAPGEILIPCLERLLAMTPHDDTRARDAITLATARKAEASVARLPSARRGPAALRPRAR